MGTHRTRKVAGSYETRGTIGTCGLYSHSAFPKTSRSWRARQLTWPVHFVRCWEVGGQRGAPGRPRPPRFSVPLLYPLFVSVHACPHCTHPQCIRGVDRSPFAIRTHPRLSSFVPALVSPFSLSPARLCTNHSWLHQLVHPCVFVPLWCVFRARRVKRQWGTMLGGGGCG